MGPGAKLRCGKGVPSGFASVWVYRKTCKYAGVNNLEGAKPVKDAYDRDEIEKSKDIFVRIVDGIEGYGDIEL
ncbi:hypothetical protein YC2023_047070 [Brassica napus]